MAYKEKTCPKCGDKHNKRGEFCSRSCGNTRKHTEATKRLIGKKKSAWLLSGDDKAESAIHSFTSLGKNKDAEPVAPVIQNDRVGSNQFVSDGDLWTEV